MRHKFQGGLFLIIVLIALPLRAAELQRMHGQVPREAANLAPLGRMPSSQRLSFAIGLPLRNQGALSNLLQQIYDPASTNFHHYLTPAQFTERFGPTAQDYEAVAAFARTNGLRIVARHPNRTLLDVEGSVADIEKALHVRMNNYQHPEEARTFYAPDTDPSLDLALPVAGISGLDNFARPRPRLIATPLVNGRHATPNGGSGLNGTYLGKDFRAAYAPDSTLTGTGQSVGLLQFDGYTASDITYYETLAGLPNVPLTNVLLDGFDGSPSGSGGEVEVSLDIEMSISMAPGLSKVIVYMAGPFGDWHDILNRMANDNLARQLSCSWFIRDGLEDPVADGIFQQMAAQGQSFMAASGDSGAYSGLIPFPGDTPYITEVGGTTLTTSGPLGAWVSETVWTPFSGGGISTQYPIPSWQAPLSMAANYGSTTQRNTPDVALTADNIYVRADGFDYFVTGTSCASPLWAGFTSLMNQQAAANGLPPVGFLNPSVYRVGLGGSYGQAFHDITTGNNGSATHFPAVAGYDLATGWGTPRGQQSINAIVPPDPLLVSPATGFAATGAKGGPFSITSQNFTLTNLSLGPLTWSVGNPVTWLGTSSSGGVLLAGSATNLLVSLNSASSNLAPGFYSANLAVTNVTSNFTHLLPFSLLVHDPLVIAPTNGFNSVGPVGGPFSVTSLNLSLSNSGLGALNWSLSNNASWLNASPGVGTLASGAATNVTVSLNAAANTLPPALYSANLVFSNLTGGPVQSVPFTLQTGELPLQNNGFELGNFLGWTVSGNTVGMLVTSNSLYVHSGVYGAQLGPRTTPGYLSQTLATGPGQVYLISFWLENEGVGGANDFQVDWNGSVVFDMANAGPSSWTNIQILVGATGTTSVLQFGVRNDNGNFGLDDVAVFQSSVTGTPPTITSQPTNETVTAGLTATFSAAATGIQPLYYQWQLGASNIAGPNNATLVLSPTTLAEAGSYRLVVSNAFGLTNSSNAVLTVNVPACDPPPSGLVSWWAAEGSGNDSFGTNNGTLVGGAGFATGEVGQSFNLDGVSQYVDVPNNSALNPTSRLTCEAWVYLRQPAVSSTAPVIKKAGEGLATQDGFALEIPTNGALFGVYVNGTWCISSYGFVPLNQWTHLAGVYDGTNVMIYVNGVLAATPVYAPGVITSSGNDLQIGHDPSSPTRYLNGLIDEASVYNTALSAAQIQAIYNAGSAGKCASRPVIASQPQSQAVYQGSTASFSVGAAGTQPLHYQWRLGTSNIFGATNSTLALTNAQLSQSGNVYSVQVTNLIGATNSSNALLTVTLPPPCDPPPSGLVGWWAAAGNANDSIGTNNGTLVGGAGFATGEVGQAFSFDGVSQYVDVANNATLNPTGSVTLEAWINPSSFPFSSPIIKKAGIGTANPVDGYALEIGGSNGVIFGVFVNGQWYLASYAPVPLNQWSHVAGVYDGTNVLVYRNGVLMTSSPAGPGTIGASPNDLQIGHDPSTPDRYFNGLIDEASVYSTALSAAQIQAIYLAGSGGKCAVPPVIVSQPQAQTAATGGTAAFSVGATGSQPLGYQWLVNNTNISAATNATLTVTNVQPGLSGNLYSVLVTNVAGATNSSGAALTVFAPGTCDPPPAGLVGWWAAEGNANDSIGTNNGTLVGGAGFAGGEVGQAFSFNGTSQYMDVPNNAHLNPTGSITLEAWINPKSLLINGTGNTDTPIIKKAGEGTIPNDGYSVEMVANATPGASNNIIFGTYLSAGIGWVSTPAVPVPTNQWTHVAGVYDGTNLLFYVNGVLAAGPVYAPGVIVASGNDLQIGHDPSIATRYFNGLIDEASVYSTALSAAQIQAIYSAGSGGKCEPHAPPKIVSQPTNQAVALGGTATFSVGATGTVPLSYQWQFNQNNISASANPTATNATLVLNNAHGANAGNYTVVVTNLAGSTNSSNAVLTVLFPPVITLEPVGQLVQPGCTVIFNSAAVGTGTLAYQWQRSGTNLPGQTGTNLAVLNVQPSDFGNYTMIASSAYGSATSAVAVLAPDHLPVPGGVIVQRYPGAGIRINTSTLLTGATDADGDPLSLINVATNSVAGGSVTRNGISIYYLPPAGLTNADAFNYTLSDGHCEGTAVGTVLVDVRGDMNPASRVTIVELGNGSVQVIFDGLPGVAYRVQSTTSLTPSNWQNAATLTADQYGTYIYTDWPATNGPVRYFRSVTP